MSVKLKTPSNGSVTLAPEDTASDVVVSLPASTGVIASTTATQTFTNKTLTNPTINGFTGDTSVINIGSGQIYKDASGNVGIGLTPNNDFEIGGRGNGVDVVTRIMTTATSPAGGSTRFVQTVGANTGLVTWTSDPGQNGTGRGFAFAVGTSERMRITAAGDVGIGKAPEAQSGFTILDLGSASTSGLIDLRRNGNRQLRIYNSSDNSSLENSAAGGSILFLTKTSGGSTGERARITSAGDLLIGATSTSNLGSAVGTQIVAGGFVYTTADGDAPGGFARRSNNGNVVLLRRDATTVGTISVTTTATAYNTSSDQRLKQNIVDAPSASDSIDAIQIRSFDWKADGSHQKYGVIAQELEAIAPEAVSKGEKEDDMWGVDYSKLVPMLIKEVQSLRARVAQLEGE